MRSKFTIAQEFTMATPPALTQFSWVLQAFFPSIRTHWIGANPEKSENLVNTGFCCFPRKIGKMLPKPRFSKPIFGPPQGQLDWTGPIANSSDSKRGLGAGKVT